MPDPMVIDLSHHNVIPNSLRPARAAGIVGVIHKCTEGTSVLDDKCAARFHLARQAGLLWGLYHFLRPGDLGAQAAYFLETARALGVLDDATLLAADYEVEGITLDDLVVFLTTVEEYAGRSPVLYSGHTLKDALGGAPDARLTRYRLWLAHYSSTYTVPPGWTAPWLWQYSDQGVVPGVTPPTDVNAFLDTPEQLTAQWAGTVPAPAPVPGPEPLTLTVRLQVQANVPVQVIVEHPEASR